MIREVTMYRVECDADGCDESPQEGSDYYAWLQPDVPLDEARDSGWYIGEFGEFCDDHVPRCPCGGWIRGDDDAPNGLCEDCDEALVEAVNG